VSRPVLTRPAASPVPAGHLDRSETLVTAIADLALDFPDYECLIVLDRAWREERTDLAGFFARAKAFQAAFVERGVRPDDTVVLILPTGSDLVSAYFGAMFAGAIPALAAPPSNRVSDHSVYLDLAGKILRNAEAKVVCCDREVARLLVEAPVELRGGAAILCAEDVPAAAHAGRELPTHSPSPTDVATIQYSSGTTGDPKGVVLTHQAMLNYMRLLRDGAGLRADEVHVNWAPLYHDMGLFGAFLMPLLCGCPTVLIPTMDFLRDPTLWLWAIDGYRGGVSWAPNFAYSLCAQRIDDDEIEGLDLSSWRIAFNASEPVLAPTIRAFADRFGPYGYRPQAMTAAWGLAETVMVGMVHPTAEEPLVDTIDRAVLAAEGRAEPTPGEGLEIVATGVALPNVEIEIRDAETGERLPDRRLGALWLPSNCLFEGYKNAPELTDAIRVDGWLDTGDRGYTVEGNLFFVSRAKDLIVIGGEKYAPHDVEFAIGRVPGVREGCAVAFGVENQEQGTEEVGAVVETRIEDEQERAELARAIGREVARTIGIGIRRLHLVGPGGINKTTSGKLARRATRARYPEIFDTPREPGV
jgi:acyl-CoA synthetase (AMP-forming)/AMP-acid ligase II